MTASAYVAEVKKQYGLTLRVRTDGNLVTNPRGSKLPILVKTMLVAFRHQVVAYLRDGQDSTLSLDVGRKQLTDLGFEALDDVPGKPLCHPEGDTIGDQILTGLLDGHAIKAEREVKRRKQARAQRSR